MNRYRPQKKEREGQGKMLKTLLKLEEGEVPDRKANGWKVEGRSEDGCNMAQKGTWNIATKRIREDREALSKKDGDPVTDYKATHDENFLAE